MILFSSSVYFIDYGPFADMEITKDDRYILEQLIEKVTIQEIEAKIKVLVYFVDIGLISVAAL